MTVRNVTMWEPLPGKGQATIENMAAATKISTRLGGTVTARQTLVGGPESQRLNLAIIHADMKAYAAFSQKLQADTEWQSFLQTVIASPTPNARLVNNILAVNVPGVAESPPLPAAEVAQVLQFQIKPGRLPEAIEVTNAAKKALESRGARLSAMTTVIAGTQSGNYVTLVEYANLAEYGRIYEELQTDAEFQGQVQARILGPDPAGELISAALFTTLPI